MPHRMSAPASPSRINLVDALRGSALAGLFLVHCIEQFELGRRPEHSPAWLRALDGWTYDSTVFLFGGKAYAIFAMLFGLSFFLQLESAARRGEAYRGRFVWRLMVLAGIGYLDGLLFCGDILMIIAVLGLPLVLLTHASNRLIGLIAVLLLLQFPGIWTAGRVLFLDYAPPRPVHWDLYGQFGEIFARGSFTEVIKANLTGGQTLRFWFTYESGRYLQMPGLFLCGLLLGRSRVFEDSARAMRFGRRALLFGALGFVVLYPLAHWGGALAPAGVARFTIRSLLGGYANLAQMLVWIGGFILLYHGTRAQRWLHWLAPYGRTSLTSYVTQGLVWVPFYYGFGLGMYQHLGATLSILAGLPFLVLQCGAAHVWLRHFRYGPLEWFWRSCTRGTFATPLRRAEPAPVAVAG